MQTARLIAKVQVDRGAVIEVYITERGRRLRRCDSCTPRRSRIHRCPGCETNCLPYGISRFGPPVTRHPAARSPQRKRLGRSAPVLKSGLRTFIMSPSPACCRIMAARRGAGLPMADLDDGESIEMQGSGAKPYVLKNVGGVYSCTCPAWRNQSVADRAAHVQAPPQAARRGGGARAAGRRTAARPATGGGGAGRARRSCWPRPGTTRRT